MTLAGQYSSRGSDLLAPQAEGSWEDCMRSGVQQIRDDDAEAAVTFFRRATILRPEHPTTCLNLAAALLRAGEHDEALQIYDRLLAQCPDQPTVHHGRGLALSALHHRDGALIAFREAIERDPDSWRSWASIADLTADEAERQHAVGRVADALERHCQAPNAPPASLVECARALINAHRHADAERFIRRHLPRFPDASIAHDRLASARYRRGDYAGAFRAAQDALRALEPGAIPVEPRPNPFAPDAAVEALGEVMDILEGTGLQPFLVAGTLLGFHRNGGPLPHDRDVDIGVLRPPDSAFDVVAIVREHPDLLLRHDHRPGNRYIALMHRGIGIDVFLHDAEGDHMLCGMTDQPGDIRWRFTRFGLTCADNSGRGWRIPDAPERYLAETYGPRWQYPDPGFASAISSPALYEVDPHVRAYYAMSRARQSMLSGDRAKAKALLRQSPIPVQDDIEREPCLNAST